MRVSLPDILTNGAGAIGAFTCYDLETAGAVLDASGDARMPVVLLIAPRTFATAAGELLLRSLVACADAAPTPAVVQLDHAEDLALMARALELGAGAIMADGSRLTLAENIALVHRAVEMAHVYGAHVECELGHLAGDEDRASAVEAGALTDPREAAQLVEHSGAACLAVSIGNVHGHYKSQPDIDLSRLEEIATRVTIPLSLHGASGLPSATVRDCVARGIRKVNVNTELRGVYLDATQERLPRVREGYDLAQLHAWQRAAVRQAVMAKFALFRDH